MIKKTFWLFTLTTLVLTSVFAGIDEIAIYNEHVGWTTVGAAVEATNQILKNVKSATSVKVFDMDGIAEFIKRSAEDNTTDVIILFGYLPETVYEPGNSQEDDSLIEAFINGGNIVMNTADYIFYVTKGGGTNGEEGLKTITNSDFDCWGNKEDIFKPTDDGKKYVPSLPVEYNSRRPMKKLQIDTDDKWEIEISFGTTEDGEKHDPVIVKNKKTGGRFVIVRQTDEAAPDRRTVLSEIIDNYLGPTVEIESSSFEKWRAKLTIISENTNLNRRAVYFGASPEATTMFDPELDRIAPPNPRPPILIDAFFPMDGTYINRLYTNIHPVAQSQFYLLQVESVDDGFSLNWQPALIPHEYDSATLQTPIDQIDMRKQQQANFPPGTHQFKIALINQQDWVSHIQVSSSSSQISSRSLSFGVKSGRVSGFDAELDQIAPPQPVEPVLLDAYFPNMIEDTNLSRLANRIRAFESVSKPLDFTFIVRSDANSFQLD